MNHRESKMKKLTLLSMVAMLMASLVFAPVATAQEPGEFAIQSATLGPEGSIKVTGTVQCTEGDFYYITVWARQAQGNQPLRTGAGTTESTCQTTGPESFTVKVYGDIGSRPFRKGDVLLTAATAYCPDTDCEYTQFDQVIQVR